MKYLKGTNAPLNILKDSKYGSVEDKMPWAFIGFKATLISAQSVSYTDEDGDFIQYLPISNEAKLNAFLPDMNSDVSDLGENCSFEVVEDDHAAWKVLADASRKPKVSDSEKVIGAGWTINGNNTPITDFNAATSLVMTGLQMLAIEGVSTTTFTVPGVVTGTADLITYEATKDDLLKIIAGLETIRSNAAKVEAGTLSLDEVVIPHAL